MKLRLTLVMLCLLAAASGALAADPDLPRTLAASCANCHGTDGHAVKGAGLDALAGMDKERTLQKLADFKSGVRPATIMHQIVRGYTDEQIELIAGYFATQK